MNKRNICVLFGGVSPEHEVSLRSAESVLLNLDQERYHIVPVGITKDGQWIYYAGTDYSSLPSGTWQTHPQNCPAAISPVRGQGLLLFGEDGCKSLKLDAVFPVLHGENGEDGAIQGLMQLANIPCVGPGLGASASCMDKTLTKLVMDKAAIPQAGWYLVHKASLSSRMEEVLDGVERRFSYPVFVKPAGTGSSVGISKASDRSQLERGILEALQYGEKALVEEFINGREIEVAVLGNDNPVASVCGEIDSGADFYDYNAKYVTDTSVAYIPARISQEVEEKVRDLAIRAYKAAGCKGMSRVDFFVTYAGDQVILNEINTIPGFTSISMYPKLFAASGIAYSDLLDMLIGLAVEAGE